MYIHGLFQLELSQVSQHHLEQSLTLFTYYIVTRGLFWVCVPKIIYCPM